MIVLLRHFTLLQANLELADERSKRKRGDDGPDSVLPEPPASAGLPAPPPPLGDSPLRRRDEADRRYGDKPARSRDPRDDYDDGPGYRRGSTRDRSVDVERRRLVDSLVVVTCGHG